MHSREVDGIIAYMMSTGTPFKVTDVDTPGVHATGSYHYRPGTGGTGLAADLAGLTPSANSPSLLGIFNQLAQVGGQLAELIYSGAPYSIKNGRRVPRYAIDAHWNHVHVAVPLGTILKEPVMPDDPNMPNITYPVEFHPVVNSDGVCQGYYLFSVKTGEIHAYGPGAPFYGRSEIVGG